MSEVSDLAFCPDGRLLASGSSDGSVTVWDVATGSLVRTFTGNTEAIASLAFSPDNRLLAVGALTRSLIVWDVETGRELYHLTTQNLQRVLDDPVFSPDGSVLVASAHDDGSSTMKFWVVTNKCFLSSAVRTSSAVDQCAGVC